ncbi:MAG: DUF4286 family protein [Myxococcota bacterium]|nr:DUF4286 family protein [Myxococcota bacterium]
MSLIYEVNLEVNDSIVAHFSDWLTNHIQEMLKFEGFNSAQWYSRQNLDEENHNPVQLWTIHYQLSDREAYEHYILNHAESMRTDGLNRFGGQFQAYRRLLYRESTYAL